MNRNEFITRLKENGIPPEIVSFDSSTNDGYNIRKNKLHWETFIRERGKEYNCIGFPSESDAMQHMFEGEVPLSCCKRDIHKFWAKKSLPFKKKFSIVN